MTLFEFFDGLSDGIACESGGAVDGDDAASSECDGFGGCPEAFLLFVEYFEKWY